MPGITLRVTRLVLNGDEVQAAATLVAQRARVERDRPGEPTWAVAGTVEASTLPAEAFVEIEAGARQFSGRAKLSSAPLPVHGWTGALRQAGVTFRYDGDGDLAGLEERDFREG